jgi:hypothetical protein
MPQRLTDVSLQLGAQTLAAKAELEKSGYSVPGRPVIELPRLPINLTEITDDQLMELFSTIVRWLDHIGGWLVLHEVDERYAESTYDLVWSTVLSNCVAGQSGKSRSESSVTVAKAEATQNPDVRAARDNRDAVYARRKIFGLMMSNLERDSALVSRELTRRVGRHDRESRTDRWKP